MDFDNPKVYGDTSIADGLVLIDSYIYNDYTFDDSKHRFYPNFKMQSRKSMQCWIYCTFLNLTDSFDILAVIFKANIVTPE